MPLRDDQRVQRRLRVDVVEYEDAIVLVHHRRRDLLAHDPAEQTVAHRLLPGRLSAAPTTSVPIDSVRGPPRVT